jgi:hypothetical protein
MAFFDGRPGGFFLSPLSSFPPFDLSTFNDSGRFLRFGDSWGTFIEEP